MDLTLDEYMDLTLKMLPLVISKLEKKLVEIEKEMEKSGPQNAMQIIMGAVLGLRAEVGQELLPEGITEEDLDNFKKEHEKEIADYLAAHPEIKQKMESLEQDFKSKFPFG